ncbi:MAG: succinate dehydrogenase, cytochrome b556 subunit [Chloroflexi bacterium]|nr:succinate dehydrogenase, cytochrome b556 subunit [Chloroflexota bacterium]
MSLVKRYPDIHPAHYRIGAWAWLAHRLTGIGIAAYLVAHIIVISSGLSGGATFDEVLAGLQRPLFLALDIVLLGVILYHALNGLRILLFDLGIGIRQQKPLFWSFMGVGVVVFALMTLFILPFVLGRPLS